MRRSSAFWYALLLIAICALAAFVKLEALGTTVSSDYQEYVQTAEAFAGVPGVEPAAHRILKPLAPLVVAGLSPLFGFENGMLFQALVLYLAFALALYLLAREFLDDDVLALLVALMAALSYPMMKYGIDVLTETGAMFFVVLSLWLTLRFLKAPRIYEFLINVLLVAIGFLWKEYSVVAGAVLGLAILFHPLLAWRVKARFIGFYAALFAIIHVPWQLFVYKTYGFSYFTWYGDNAGPGFAMEFTLKNVLKSTAGVLGLAWFLVPFGMKAYPALLPWRRRFLAVAAPPPFIAYAWGYVSSRLLYVLAPPFLLLAALPMRAWTRRTQIYCTAVVIATNLTWLFLSYSIKL